MCDIYVKCLISYNSIQQKNYQKKKTKKVITVFLSMLLLKMWLKTDVINSKNKKKTISSYKNLYNSMFSFSS